MTSILLVTETGLLTNAVDMDPARRAFILREHILVPFQYLAEYHLTFLG